MLTGIITIISSIISLPGRWGQLGRETSDITPGSASWQSLKGKKYSSTSGIFVAHSVQEGRMCDMMTHLGNVHPLFIYIKPECLFPTVCQG